MSTAQPLFTVATITYNSSKWVREAIESILSSSFTDFELIISDDCSTDHTWDIIQEFQDPRIKAWKNAYNIGEYPNRNKILEHAEGKYLLFVDGDDILYKTTLRNLSEYIDAFPDAGMIWGLNPQHFPFFVFPYLVHPKVNLQLIYQTVIPIATIGFGEILFKTEVLRQKGPFSTLYKIGDTYTKKKLALTESVLFVTIGFMFWRQSANQASKKIPLYGMDSFLERVTIDKEILNDEYFPVSGKEFEQIKMNFRISMVKLFFSSTLFKGKIRSFITYGRKLGIRFSDYFLLFQKGDYSYLPASDFGSPLMNDFHFKKEN
jgi:glycosyltransferase involved in cell wall biosynthesis